MLDGSEVVVDGVIEYFDVGGNIFEFFNKVWMKKCNVFIDWTVCERFGVVKLMCEEKMECVVVVWVFVLEVFVLVLMLVMEGE